MIMKTTHACCRKYQEKNHPILFYHMEQTAENTLGISLRLLFYVHIYYPHSTTFGWRKCLGQTSFIIRGCQFFPSLS